jgi:hypothetical protein
VGDDDARAVHAREGRVDLSLGDGVQRAGGLVEQEDRRLVPQNQRGKVFGDRAMRATVSDATRKASFATVSSVRTPAKVGSINRAKITAFALLRASIMSWAAFMRPQTTNVTILA